MYTRERPIGRYHSGGRISKPRQIPNVVNRIPKCTASDLPCVPHGRGPTTLRKFLYPSVQLAGGPWEATPEGAETTTVDTHHKSSANLLRYEEPLLYANLVAMILESEFLLLVEERSIIPRSERGTNLCIISLSNLKRYLTRYRTQ
ncbi:hypothetical protein PM082_023026 [Marasmius tenuissimus]|nr:hypothetical protein PM082_023026 [Marasmius tenuissimus]